MSAGTCERDPTDQCCDCGRWPGERCAELDREDAEAYDAAMAAAEAARAAATSTAAPSMRWPSDFAAKHERVCVELQPCVPGRFCARYARGLGGCVAGYCNPPSDQGGTEARHA